MSASSLLVHRSLVGAMVDYGLLSSLSPGDDAQPSLRLVGMYHTVILRTGVGYPMNEHRGCSLILDLNCQFFHSFQSREFPCFKSLKLPYFAQNQEVVS